MALSRSKVFVITPFDKSFMALFEELKKEFGSEYEFTNAGDMDNQRNILKDIVDGIASADVVIADLTGLNANVFYELGLAHAMYKKVIIITQNIDELPFDIQAYRANQYSMEFYKFPEFTSKLKKLLDGAIDGSIQYGNPITDFAPSFFKNKNSGIHSVQSDDSNSTNGQDDINEDDNDEGFLDNIAGISENLQLMYEEIVSINSEMIDMGDSVTNVTNEINNTNEKSGNLDPAYICNTCRKLSTPINNCAVKLNDHVNDVTLYWNKIENNYLELLDSHFAQQAQNKSQLEESVASLNDLKEAIHTSNTQVEAVITASRTCLGIERRLTKAIKTLITALENYLTMTNMIFSSIDRINNKCNVIIDTVSD